jgi:hypothetical protein
MHLSSSGVQSTTGAAALLAGARQSTSAAEALFKSARRTSASALSTTSRTSCHVCSFSGFVLSASLSNYLPHSWITCVDTFVADKEHQSDPMWKHQIAESEKRFDKNLFALAARVEKIKSTSISAQIRLALKQQRFDLIYLDGGHLAGDVYSDATLALGGA